MRKLLFLTVSCIVFVQQVAHAMHPYSVAGFNQRDLEGWTELLYKRAVHRLLANKEVDVDLQDSDGQTLLHFATSKGHDAVVRILIDHNAKVNQQDGSGETPLHKAAKCGYKYVARLLLEHNADVNQKSNCGLTPLQLATLFHHEAVIRLLQKWLIMQQQANAARLAFYCTLHPRAGANSQARVLNSYLIHEILQHVQPADFSVISAAVAPVVPAPTVPQRALANAQSFVSNPRVQIAATTITVLSFVAWRLLHH